MANSDWRYLAGRLVGDGTIEVIADELPIKVSSLDRKLSAPSALSGTISHAAARLRVDGQPIFDPWNTIIIAEAAGLIRGMGVYQKPTWNGTDWSIDAVGLSAYPQGMPYDGSISFVGADPLDIFRHIWSHLQSFPGGNLGITIDSLTSPVRVGTASEDVQFTTGGGESVAFEAGPRKLNWYTTDDLGSEIDSYAKETPFDWVEQPSWGADDRPHCHLALGYPTIGTRRDDLRLVFGENLTSEPSVSAADSYNSVLVRGAGEGRDAVRAMATVADGRIRRIKSIEDKKQTSVRQAQATAEAALAGARGQLIVETLEVVDHPNAPLESIQLGDEIPVYAELPWVTVDQWARVVGRSESPDSSANVTLTVLRTGVA